MSHISSSAFSDTKAHYDLLDGLRGVAALMVIWYHIFEGYAFAGGSIIETFNHGYLAVDFFFILSGFVIGYAYDDRWGRNLQWKLFKRRLIRLHPMVIMELSWVPLLSVFKDAYNGTEHILPSPWLCCPFFALYFLFPQCQVQVMKSVVMAKCFLWMVHAGPCFFEYLGNILLCLVYPPLIKQSPCRTDNIAGSGIGIISFSTSPDTEIWGRLDTGRNKLWRRIAEDAFSFLHGHAFVAQLQAYQGERCFLDMCHCIGYLVFSALLGRCNTGLYKWHLWSVLCNHRFSGSRLVRSFRYHNG